MPTVTEKKYHGNRWSVWRTVGAFICVYIVVDIISYWFGSNCISVTLYTAYLAQHGYMLFPSPSKPIWNIPNTYKFTGCAISDYFGHGTIYNCSKCNSSSTLRVVMVTLMIDQIDSSNQLFIDNHRNYALIHGYTYIIINKSFINKSYSHQQKPYIFYHVMMHITNVDYILIMDMDILFLNCWISIDNVIDYISQIDVYRNNHALDLIFSADHNGPNVGVLLFKYSSWSTHFMYNWQYLINHKTNLYEFHEALFIDQNSFTALIFGFDIDTTIKYPNNHNHAYAIDYDPRFNYNKKPGPKNYQYSIIKWYNKYLLDTVSSNHVAIIPEIYLNNVLKGRRKQYWFKQSQEFPLLIHFAGLKNFSVKQYITTSTCKQTVFELKKSNSF